MRVYLIGMMGSGKTTCGKMLSEKVNYKFYDLDLLIEETYKMSIKDIFSNLGEDTFREYETNVLKSITDSNCIISCGGGIVTRSVNLDYMNGLVVYLKSDLKDIKVRIGKDESRPLLKDIDSLYESRKEMYDLFSDCVITKREVSDIVEDIFKVMCINKKVLVINGPNLNLLHKRNVHHYGGKGLDYICDLMAKDNSISFDFYQSNHEGDIVDCIQKLDSYDGLIINPAAYTHTSVAIRDALEIFDVPKVEVHLSDVNNRDDFRKVNFITEVCSVAISGKYERSYIEAVKYLKKIFFN